MKGVWIARMETEHYEWTAVGKTKEEAINAIADEWQNGVGHEYREPMTGKELDNYYGISYNYYEFGKCQWR